MFGKFVFFYEQKDNKNSSKSFFGLKNDKMPPVIKELENFGKKIVQIGTKHRISEKTVANFKKAFL